MQIKMAIKSLVEFVLRSGDIDNRFTGTDRALLGSDIHRKLQKQAGKCYTAEKTLTTVFRDNDIEYVLFGRADGIIRENDTVTIDEIKTVSVPMDKLNEDFNAAHWAQGCFYAYIVSEEEKLDIINVQLTYYNIDTDEIKRFKRKYNRDELYQAVFSVIEKYRKWAVMSAEWNEKREICLKELKFPFSIYRNGQRKLAVSVYNTIKGEDRLFVNAPTGIGKTMSVIFPAMKAIGENLSDKVFYLTAKGITSEAAINAYDILYGENPDLNFRIIRISAKDKMCIQDKRECNPVQCPYARGYFDKINDVIYDELSGNKIFSPELILSIARKNKVCPYELSLDLSQWCDSVICDYNYLFDPVVKLQRFFSGGKGNYTFLIDEAHNLPDRAREMFSGGISKKSVLAAKKAVPSYEKKLNNAINKLNSFLLEKRKDLEERSLNDNVLIDIPDNTEKIMRKFRSECADFFDRHKNETTDDDLLQLYFDVKFFLKILDDYDEDYVTIISRFSDELVIRLFCTNPSRKVDERLSKGKSSVLFSATLTPSSFYRELLGEKGEIVRIESPFSQDNLGLFVLDQISTKYSDRNKTLSEVCDIIHTVYSSKQGNYIVYFPSYAYLSRTKEKYVLRYNDEITVQNRDMTDTEREEFLKKFSENNNILAFCVMGGVYGEGIDLKGDMLVGSIIVGVGLPQINTQLDTIKNHFEKEGKDGFAYAYQFPGMNKVLQAAGRVIRTESDRGVVVLIDARFTTSRYLKIMPPHWNHLRRIDNKQTLSEELSLFWNS